MMSPTRPVGINDHVFLIDGSSFVFRAYFQSIRQDAKYNYRSDGLPVGAVRLFATKMLQFLRDGAVGLTPTHMAIIFDKSENSFRRELYALYKAHRPAPPQDLIPQFPLMRAAVRAFGLVPIEQERYEADDLIATYAQQAQERGAQVLIISADKDLMQLIAPGVAMFDPASGSGDKRREDRHIGVEEVIAYFGVPPNQVVDVQALAGDASDNIPGAPGIGLKTAIQLIQDYGSLEALLARAGEIKQQKRRETLTDPQTVALIRISQQLVTLKRDVALTYPLDTLAVPEIDAHTLIAFLKAMEFNALTRRVGDLYKVDPERIAPAAEFAISAIGVVVPLSEELSPQSLASARATQMKALSFDTSTYTCIRSKEELDLWIARAMNAGIVAFDTETSSLDPLQAELIGFSLALAPGEACYVPLNHVRGEDLFSKGRLPNQMDEEQALRQLKPLLEAKHVLKIGQNIKFDGHILKARGISIAPYDDTMLLSYVLDSGLNSDGHGMNALSLRWLGHKPIDFAEVAGSGRHFIGFACVPIEQATAYAAEDADISLRLWRVLKPRLVAQGLTQVYETLERPLVETLVQMEARGIMIDRHVLARLAGEFAQDMAKMEAKIATIVGAPLNPASPKQVSEVLFGQMGLPGGKKTPTGAWSTQASVLEDLAEQGHELPCQILAWRQLAKLKSTYADALPEFINPTTGRVHTRFSLAATTTGRLSSSDPNLQNIPIRNEEGRRIRRAFIAAPGYKLISADYSQIELRLLAHIATIPSLVQAFREGVDIHAMTASEIFGVPVAGMPSEIRRRAKAINFGIIYGISPFGLANQLGIARNEAARYIHDYFERFPGIRDYMEATKTQARQKGYVTTLFGRQCHFPRIHSPNASERAFNERAAINAPIQGSAADIIRRAMIRMDNALSHAHLSARMLLQVHDELVFEVPNDEVEETLRIVKHVMTQAPMPALSLAVPLVVDARAADTWDEAH